MTRRATIRTTHDDPELVAAAIAPDNTAEMETTVDGDGVCTRIERETTGGLHATVDDYVVNVDVATTVAQHADEHRHADAAADSNRD
ncbi:KEOPS complex subunit Pcc1 [Natronoglomus mannanivorans]|uniref:KEOPS complex subunit Pcc1 n=1 Tax=Natronoglomus mannanivorans TaxID=2979990 RepID=A0AAP2Z0G8_9EURY|nr:KEOPS complex subunit Pcc1 [Halobacteria archaeon AArc-xg1-1]